MRLSPQGRRTDGPVYCAFCQDCAAHQLHSRAVTASLLVRLRGRPVRQCNRKHKSFELGGTARKILRSSRSRHRLLRGSVERQRLDQSRDFSGPLRVTLRKPRRSYLDLDRRSNPRAARKPLRRLYRDTDQDSDFACHVTEVQKMRDRKGQQASPQDGCHHIQTNTRRHRNG